MKTQIQRSNPNVMTGLGYVFGLDMDRGFYSYEAGALDAPVYTPTGSTIENVITDIKDLEGRYVIAGLVYRA